MSIALMTAAWSLDLPSTDKLVLLALADNANDAGCCWPSLATIGKKSGLCERAVRNAVRRLEGAGHLTSDQRPGKGVVYTVHPGTTCRPEGRHQMPPAPAPDAGDPGTTCPQTINEPKRTSQKTSSSSKARAKKSDGEPFVLPDWVPADAWAGWIEMRKRAGKTPTRRAMQLAIGELKKLADDGHPPGAVLDQSTFRQWPGLFPIKDNRHDQYRDTFGSPPHGAQHGSEGVGKTVLAARGAIARLSGIENR